MTDPRRSGRDRGVGDRAGSVTAGSPMTDLLHFNRTGQAAAFFDLDRTLISGSSAFVFGVAAWRADMLPTKQFAHDARVAIAFKLRGDKFSTVRSGRCLTLRRRADQRRPAWMAIGGQLSCLLHRRAQLSGGRRSVAPCCVRTRIISRPAAAAGRGPRSQEQDHG